MGKKNTCGMCTCGKNKGLSGSDHAAHGLLTALTGGAWGILWVGHSAKRKVLPKNEEPTANDVCPCACHDKAKDE